MKLLPKVRQACERILVYIQVPIVVLVLKQNALGWWIILLYCSRLQATVKRIEAHRFSFARSEFYFSNYSTAHNCVLKRQLVYYTIRYYIYHYTATLISNLKENSLQAPSTRIATRIILNPQLFLSEFKNFPLHTQRASIEFACPQASRIQTYMLCRHIGLLVSKRMDTILLRHRIPKHPDSPSIRYRTRCGLIFFFFTLEIGYKNIRIRC